MKQNILIEMYITLQLQNYNTNRALDCDQQLKCILTAQNLAIIWLNVNKLGVSAMIHLWV